MKFFKQFYRINLLTLENYFNHLYSFYHRHILFSLALFLFGLSTVSLQAQNKYVDSLKLELDRKDLSDSLKVDVLINLGDKLGYADAKEAMKYLNEAYKLAGSKNLYVKMGDALTGIGQAYYRTDNLDSCLYFLTLADTLYQKSNTTDAKISLISSKMNIATVLRTMGNSSAALPMYLEGIDSLQSMNFPGKDLKLVIAFMNIGLLYNEMNQYDKALFYHRKGMAIAEKNHLTDLRVYYLKLHIIHDFMELKMYDSAKHYLAKEENEFKQLNQPDILSQLYSNWGIYYLHREDTIKALESFNYSYEYAVKSNNNFRQEQMLARLASIYKKKKDYTKSILYFRKAAELSHRIKDKPSEMHYLRNIAELYAASNQNNKAVQYYQQYLDLSDSLNEAAIKKQINEIENKYQAKQKQDSILVLKKNNEIQLLSLNKRKNLNYVLLTVVVLSGLIGILIYRNMRHRHYIMEQNGMLNKQRIQELEKEHQLVAMQSVLKGQEDERSRLAKDLHDGVGGLLSGVKLSLSTMKGNVFLSEQNAQSVNVVIEQLDQSIAELRRVSHNMMPEALIKYGLKEALENYCENINLSGTLKVQLQTYGLDDRMEQSTEIILYRMVQELLNNVIKHSEAKNVLVQLTREEDRFSLTVEDDGEGFDITKSGGNEGAGFANVKARAEYLNGTVDIQSVQGEGTSVNIMGKCG